MYLLTSGDTLASISQKKLRRTLMRLVRELDGLVMDGGVRGKGDGLLRYEMEIRGKKVKYETNVLAPAAGVCAINYCR